MNDQEVSIRDKRKHPRCKLDAAVGVTCQDQFLVQNCVEISEGGMLLRVFSSYKPGDRLEVSLFLKNQFITAECEVVHTREPAPGQGHVGVKFSQTADSVRTTIRSYVESILSV